jgi:uncharacterized protein (DUF1778 family)
MARKSAQLQIRVTAAQKARLRQLARRAGEDISAYVLSRALPAAQERFQRAVTALRDETDQRFAFAEVGDALADLGAAELERTVGAADTTGLSAFAENYLAATVEHLCASRGVPAPAWASAIQPLDAPWFAASLRSLRPHLMRSSPVAFKRRNLFIDAGPDARV